MEEEKQGIHWGVALAIALVASIIMQTLFTKLPRIPSGSDMFLMHLLPTALGEMFLAWIVSFFIAWGAKFSKVNTFLWTFAVIQLLKVTTFFIDR